MIGERVRLARETCRLTQQDLASLSGIPLGTIGSIEAGTTSVPSDAILSTIALATGFPESFFSKGPLPDLPEGFYRKLKRGSAKDAKQFRAQVRQVVEVVQRAESQLKLPPVTLEPVRIVDSLDHVDEIAADVRHTLGLGCRDPIPNVIRAVERAGVIVVRLPSQLEDHDSYSVWPDNIIDGRPVLALTAGHPGDRDRANTAHELGHLVLHTLRRNVDPDQAEREAWRFAGSFLLPREAAQESMRPPITLTVLKGVKGLYGTSIAFNAQVARTYELIGREQYVSLRKQLAARGWLKDEPVEVVSEKPVLLPKIAAFIAGEGSTRERADRLGTQQFLATALLG
jgi:Zn-dependent peptidase ImmA (M78 family)/DNA-binding XRE family transcriptional regulator